MRRAEWIPEAEAAKLMNYKPYTLRRLVKSGKIDIAISPANGRNYFYNKLDIDRHFNNHSTLVNS